MFQNGIGDAKIRKKGQLDKESKKFFGKDIACFRYFAYFCIVIMKRRQSGNIRVAAHEGFSGMREVSERISYKWKKRNTTY